MTERLYYTNAYLTMFSASIVDRADDGRRIYLDRTAFYPTSGGQQHDLGTLGGVAVVDVVDEEERVAHLLASPIGAGNSVSGEVDWARRWDHMQQHTGQHLLSAVCSDLFDYHTVSVHFGDVSSTLDVTADAIPADRIRTIEQRANELITENRPVTVSFEDAATATGLRKPSDREGTLRVVSIDQLDRSACGGTHVRATGEIGSLVIRKVEKAKSAMRIEFLCGMRVVRRARADFEALTSISQSFSASIDDAAAIVDARAKELKEADAQLKRANTELATFRAKALWDATTPDASGVRRATERRASGSVEEMRALALAFSSLPKAVLTAVSEQPPSILIAASPDSGFDAGKVLKQALTDAGGRGGGSPRLAQGSVPDLERLQAVLTALGNRE